MSINVENLRITPFSQKDGIAKVVFGGEWGLTIQLPTAHVSGDEYALVLDYERIVYPAEHPVCALNTEYTLQGTDLSMSVELESSRLAKWLSSLRKPTPIYMQICRLRNGSYETLLLDEILALPSMINPDMYEDPSTPIGELLNAKLDKPAEPGEPGQVLTLDSEGDPAWRDPDDASRAYAAESAESARQAGIAEDGAVDAKNLAVQANNDAQQAKTDSVSAKDLAVQANSTAQTAKTDAVNAKDAAVQAKNDAVDAKNDAVQARTDSQNARTDAQNAANAASTSSANAHTWAEGDDAAVEALGGEHSAKGWAERVGNKADRPSTSTAGNVAALTANGDLADSNIPASDVARQSGYYAAKGLGAATAENLIDVHATGVPRMFTLDTAAGEESIAGDGNGRIEEIRGVTNTFNQMVADTNINTVTGAGVVQVTDAVAGNVTALEVSGRTYARNQRIVNGNFASTDNWTYNRMTLSASGNVLTATLGTVSTSANIGNVPVAPVLQGRTILLRLDSKTAHNDTFYIRYQDDEGSIGFLASVYLHAGAWETNYFKVTLNDSGLNRIIFYPVNDTTAWQVGDTFQLRNVQLCDLTQCFGGDSTAIAAVSTWDDLVARIPEYGSYVATDAGTLINRSGTILCNETGGSATFTGLRGVGSSALDTQELVGGEKVLKTGTLHLDGTEAWANYSSGGGNQWRGFQVVDYLPDNTSRAPNVVSSPYLNSNTTTVSMAGCIQVWPGVNSSRTVYIAWPSATYTLPSELSSWYDADTDTLDVAAFKTWLTSNPIDVAYALPTATTESATPQTLTTVAGLNSFYESAPTITGTPLALKYTGTDYSIPTISGQKYLSRVNGVESVVNGGSPIAVKGGRDRLINLTRWCGAGLEPSTADGFYALYPWVRGYDMPYNQGVLKGYEGTGIDTVGFNMLNIDAPFYPTTNKDATDVKPYVANQWFVGVSNDSNNWRPSYCVASVQDGILSVAKNPSYSNFYWVGYAMRIPYTENGCQATFDVAGTIGSAAVVDAAYFDYDGMWLSRASGKYLTAGSNSYNFVPPANAYWTLLCFRNDSDTPCQISNLCVHLRWSGYRDGDYEPYWSQVRSLPVAQHFPDGMQGNGTVWDSLYPNRSVHRWQRVDLGTLEWDYYKGNWAYSMFYAALPSDRIDNTSCMCALFSYIASGGSGFVNMLDNSMNARQSSNKVFIRCDSYTSAAAFTTAMSGVYLWYQLAEPITTPIDPPWSGVYRVSDFGLELSLPQNDRTNLLTAPFRALIAYSQDYTRTITNLPRNYTSQDTLDDFLAALATSMGKTITKTWNASLNKYEFSITE